MIRWARTPVTLGCLLCGGLALAQDPEPARCVGPGAAPAPAPADSPAAEALARGTRLLAEGAPADALAAYQESERLANEAGQSELALRAAANAARAALEAGQTQGLEERLERLTEAAAAAPDATERARLLLHAGRSLVGLAERGSGRAKLRAAAAFEGAAEAAGAAGDGRLRSYALGYRAELYERDGRRGEALELARRALVAAQRAGAPEAAYLWYWQIGRIHQAAGDGAAALDAYRRAVSALAELRAQLPSDEVAFRTGVAPLHASLVDLLLLRAAEVGEDERQQLLVEARAALEDLKATELRDYFRDPCLDAQRKASPDVVPRTLVVYPVALPGRVELIVGEGGELERYATPVSGEVFEDEVRAFRRTLEKLTTREYLAHARNLYDWMIRPLAPRLEKGAIDTLVFVPGGALRTVPLAALSDRETGRFLIERYPVAITPGLTLTEPRAIDRSGVRVLAGGLSESVQGYTALENVPREIDALSAVFPAQRLLNGEFLARRLERELTSHPFGIVHIASHGEFAPDASRSYVLTYDEKVPMERVAAWVATTRFRERWPLELLALSACQTAVGDERAALGLAGLALRSGARSALATLWSVDDQASADLVSEFYAGLREPGLSRAQALQRAQLELMRKHQFRHPAFWSPFLLIGSWL